MIGPSAGTPPVYKFWGEIDTSLTSVCGTATPPTTSTTGTSGTGSTGSGSTTTPTSFSISSFYTFKLGATLLLKYTYSTTLSNFSLAPLTTTTQTCSTLDFVSCNTSGSATCETSDGLKCGGSTAFIFVNSLAGITFQGRTGTIDWKSGYSLNGDNTQVSYANLAFEMISSNGSIFQGTTTCISQPQ